MSLRDVERCLEVLVWFNDHMHMLRTLLDRRAHREQIEDEVDVGKVCFAINSNNKLFALPRLVV